MNWNALIRRAHRWISLVFVIVVAGLFVALGAGRQPAEWIYFVPLAPLALLMLSGLYLFALPYFARRSGSDEPRR